MKFLVDRAYQIKSWFDETLTSAGWFDSELIPAVPEVHSGTVLVHGGGVVTVIGQEGAKRTVLVHGGGIVTAQGFRTGGDISAPIVAGRFFPPRYIEQHFGKVAIHGAGTVVVAGEKKARSLIHISAGGRVGVCGERGRLRITGSGQIEARGVKRHPAHLRIILTALAEAA